MDIPLVDCDVSQITFANHFPNLACLSRRYYLPLGKWTAPSPFWLYPVRRPAIQGMPVRAFQALRIGGCRSIKLYVTHPHQSPSTSSTP